MDLLDADDAEQLELSAEKESKVLAFQNVLADDHGEAVLNVVIGNDDPKCRAIDTESAFHDWYTAALKNLSGMPRHKMKTSCAGT